MKILVADDDAAIREFIREFLEDEGHEVTVVKDGEEALNEFMLTWHELVICDFLMPKMNGIELLTVVKEINPNTQFVIMTSYASMDNSIEALKQGAFDYLVKPFDDLEDITAAVNRATFNLSGIYRQEYLVNTLSLENKELDSLSKEFREMAMRDGLTGMFNRRYAEERLNEEFDRAIRYGRDFSLIFMDLDHFKFFNDLNGHQAGDELLQTLTTLMTQAVRESDTLARWGGEEFVVVTPETDQEGAYILAERIRKSVAEYSFPNAAQQPLGLVSLSIGVASISIGVESCAKLIGCADDAMYSAKSASRNRTVVCSSPGKMDHAESPADSKET